MIVIDFRIPWTCSAKQSTRFTRDGRRYTPKDVAENAKALGLFMSQHRPERPLVGAVRALYEITYPWLAGHGKRQRSNGSVPKSTKPDCDNLAKQISDCAEHCGFFINDAQIYDLRVVKRFGERPEIRVHFEGEGDGT